MKIAFCTECPKPEVIAIGNFPALIPGRASNGAKKMVEPKPPSHVIDGKRHTKTKIIDIGDVPRNPGEPPGAYLVRLAKEHADKLK